MAELGFPRSILARDDQNSLKQSDMFGGWRCGCLISQGIQTRCTILKAKQFKNYVLRSTWFEGLLSHRIRVNAL